MSLAEKGSVAGETFNMIAKRRDFETKYAEAMYHFRNIYFPDTIDTNSIVPIPQGDSVAYLNHLLETNYKTYYVSYCLTFPLDKRLTTILVQNETSPSHPNTQNQILRSLAAVDDHIDGLCIDVMWGLIAETVGEEFHLDEKHDSMITKLYAQRKHLLQLLSPNRRDRYEKKRLRIRYEENCENT